jgi:hypothetical protein
MVAIELFETIALTNTTSILRIKAYISFRKSNKIKFDETFRKIYEQI